MERPPKQQQHDIISLLIILRKAGGVKQL